MPATLDHHLAFWRTLANDLDAGRPLLSALGHARSRTAGSDLEQAADALIADIENGAAFSEALTAHKALFSRCIRMMVRAGEAGGVLDVIAARVADSLRDGSFPLPGQLRAEDSPVHFWRAFGRLLSSGVPILDALDLLRAEVCGPKLAEATEIIQEAIRNGASISDTLETLPDVFGSEVRMAVDTGERGGTLDEQAFRIADAIEADDLASLVPDHGPGATVQHMDDAAPVVKAVNLILIQAIQDKASDIHIEPLEAGLKLRCRVDGVLYEMEPPPPQLARHIVNRLKIMADMDLAERRLPQDGRVHLELSGKPYDLRVSVVPTVFGERIAIRILDREAVCLDLARIGFLPDELAVVRELCHLPNGILIANGPAGSGKTTLLYAMLSEINEPGKCLLSVEDPVEYHIPGVAQVQADVRRGLTFPRVLRSFLRQDPDAILIGEIRDLETLNVAAQCSLTGHLVLTTLDTTTSPAALRRFLDVGLEPFLVNSAVAGVISQRLVRALCPECKQPAEPSLETLPPEAAAFVQSRPDAVFYEPKGCADCHDTGHRGRLGIHEILVPDDRVRRAVAVSADLGAIRNAALDAGMTPMLICGLEKAAAGKTSIREVCRVAPLSIHA